MPRLPSPGLSRRGLLLGAGALPLAAATLPRPARAAADLMGPGMTRFNRFTLGDFEVTTLLTNMSTQENPHEIFGLNVPEAEFKAAVEGRHLPNDRAKTFFTPTLVNTGKELVLFDTGEEPMQIVKALERAGYFVEDVDRVVITHMHSDHIGGLSDPAGPTFPNATYVTGSLEWDAWDDAGDDAFDTHMAPLADRTDTVSDDQSVADGITAVEAFGHTLGHMGYMVESAGKPLFIGGDFVLHHVWSLEHPDWEVVFDEDKAQAAETRKRLLDMLATDGIPFVGYHMPWPGIGYVEKDKDGGFRYVPATYQMLV